MSLTDSQRMWQLLNRSQGRGMHSHELRAAGISGNPSQRAKDITSKGQQVWKLREPRNGRPGVRFFLDGWQPDEAFPVLPNGGAEGGGADVGSAAAPLSAAPFESVWSLETGWYDRPVAA